MTAFHARTAHPTSVNTAHAILHWPVKINAAGPESATPALVPELMRALALSCRSLRIEHATASPIGGEARPLLLPATSTPRARTHAAGAAATVAMPTTATAPAAPAIRRGPVSETGEAIGDGDQSQPRRDQPRTRHHHSSPQSLTRQPAPRTTQLLPPRR